MSRQTEHDENRRPVVQERYARADESDSARAGGGTSRVAAAAPRVSVVVPSYNHSHFVSDCLRSIFKQTLAPSELLVIDDGSTDNSLAIIERELKDCPFPCELVARDNRGLCATLNEGLARTGGDFFAYLGSDDLWLADFLRERVALLERRERAVLAYGHAFLIDAENRVVDLTADWADYSDGDARPMLLRTIAPLSPTVVYRRAAVERHGWREGARLEDYELYLRLAAEGEFAFDPRVLAAWRWHGANASRDQRMMLDEQLAAQRRAGALLGLSERELSRVHSRLSFERAEDFLRLGLKRDALRLALSNLSGARSPRAVARIAARLLLPYSLVRARKRRADARRAARHGVIKM
jgi:glycosyltransferase involved in cell wall biosynthesis